MRRHLINFPSLSYLKIQQPVTPFDKFSSVTVKGLFDSLLHRKFPRYGRNRTLGRKEIEFLSNNANFQFFKQLALSIKNSQGYFQSWKNKEKLWRGGNRYQLMKKAWKVYVPIVKIHFTTLKIYVPALKVHVPVRAVLHLSFVRRRSWLSVLTATWRCFLGLKGICVTLACRVCIRDT